MAESLEIESDEATIETVEEISMREGIYGEIKRLLIARGIPSNEIAFIHDFPTPAKKSQAFAEVNAGRIRVMIASTEKAGTGVNMQERLYALHHLDTPWRPSDVEQREGRILRQGNLHKEVHLCQYVTEGSFDGYMWQTLEAKSRFISQIMAGEVTTRTAEDVDQLVMTAAQIKAIASGNPLILEKVAAEVELTRLERLYSVWRGNRRRLQNQLELLPADLEHLAHTIAGYQQAITVRDKTDSQRQQDEFRMTLRKSLASEEVSTFTDRQRAGAHLRQLTFKLAREAQSRGRLISVIGEYRGFEIIAQSSGRAVDAFSSLFTQTETALRVKAGEQAYSFNIGESDLGIIQSIDAQLRGLDHKLEQAHATERELQHRQAQITTELSKGWEHAAKYQELKAKLDTLNSQLSNAGHEIEASPELAVLDDAALQPALEIAKVLQIVSIAAHDYATEEVIAPDSLVATEPVAEALSVAACSPITTRAEETATTQPPLEDNDDDLLNHLSVFAELRQLSAQQRKPSKRKIAAANSQQMSFGWT